MKYKLIKTDLMHKGKIIPENSIVEMTEKEAEEFPDYLEVIKKKTNNQQSKSKKKGQSKRGPKSK